MDDLININVIVADRPYPIKVKPHEESSVRQAAKEINEKVKEFQQVYAAKDKQDYLAMSSLMFVVDNIRNRHRIESDEGRMASELSDLDALLADRLSR